MGAVTTIEAARLLGISRQAVLGLINRGRLEATKIGRDWHIKPDSVLGRVETSRLRP